MNEWMNKRSDQSQHKIKSGTLAKKKEEKKVLDNILAKLTWHIHLLFGIKVVLHIINTKFTMVHSQRKLGKFHNDTYTHNSQYKM